MLKIRHTFSKSCLVFIVAVLCATLGSAGVRPAFDSTPSGTTISNRAEATYEGDDGTPYSTASETVTVTVLAVATLTVTPKETSPSANVGPQERITRIFHICNSGNLENTYSVTNVTVSAPSTLVSLYFDLDASGTITSGDQQITLGSTSSPAVAPGSCAGVLAVVDTNDAQPNSLLRIDLTARSNATGAANGNPGPGRSSIQSAEVALESDQLCFAAA